MSEQLDLEAIRKWQGEDPENRSVVVFYSDIKKNLLDRCPKCEINNEALGNDNRLLLTIASAIVNDSRLSLIVNGATYVAERPEIVEIAKKITSGELIHADFFDMLGALGIEKEAKDE